MKRRSVVLAVMLIAIVSLGMGTSPRPKMAIKLPQLMYRPTPPREIKVGSVIYAVKLVGKTVDVLGGHSDGMTCDATAVKLKHCTELHTIYLAEGQWMQEERDTVVHEIQHCIFGTGKSSTKTTYHDAIRGLTPGLLRVIQDNPKLLSYLTAPVPLGM